jgi:hypothetical protein
MRHLLSAILSFWPTLVLAITPTITNVSGTVATGQTLTITGSTMMDENKTDWRSDLKTGTAYGFEGTFARNSWIESNTYYADGSDSYDTTIKLSGNQSLKNLSRGGPHDGSCSSTGGISGSRVWYNPGGSEIWYRLYTRYHVTGGWPSHYTKTPTMPMAHNPTFNVWNEIFGGSQTVWEIRPNLSSPGVYVDTPIPGSTLQDDRWYLWESHIIGNVAGKNPILEVWFENQYMFCAGPDCVSRPQCAGLSGSALSSCNNNSAQAQSTQFDGFEVGTTNLCGVLPANFELDNWIDNFALSNTTRIYPSTVVEIGNSPTYATATKVYQEPVSLADGRITIKANLAGLGAGPYYLWVTNNRQERSPAYSLGTSTTLAAPTNLRAQQ